MFGSYLISSIYWVEFDPVGFQIFKKGHGRDGFWGEFKRVWIFI